MAIKVRMADELDVPALVALGRAMHAESPRFSGVEFSESKVIDTTRELLRNPWSLVLVAERDGAVIGMIAGMVTEYFFGFERYAFDLVFFVSQEHRGSSAAVRLLSEWDRVLAEDGHVREAVLGISTGVNAERTQRLYERLGYRESGSILVKDFNKR